MFTIPRQILYVGLFGLLLCGGSNVLYAPHFTSLGPHLDIWEMTAGADFVFKGKVRSIQYSNSDIVPLLDPQTLQQIRDEEGNLVFESTSDMPHTFVTYDVLEIFRGLLPPGGPNTLTLRFMGGLSTSDPDTVAAVSGFPLFDLDDTDYLYVHDNIFFACPLINCEHSRLRALLDPNDPTQTLRMYNENGFEIVHLNDQSPRVEDQNIALGPFHEIPDVLTHHIGNNLLEMLGEGNEANDFLDPNNFNPDDPAPETPIVLGPHFTDLQFAQFMRDVADTLPRLTVPVVSADPLQPFRPFVLDPVVDDGQVFTEQEPNEFETPDRPWLSLLPPEKLVAILAAEEVEMLLVNEAGGDPVIPETPCEQQITGVSQLIADIWGPEGKPDCRVDLFDFFKVAELYLNCNDPNDPLCL